MNPTRRTFLGALAAFIAAPTAWLVSKPAKAEAVRRSVIHLGPVPEEQRFTSTLDALRFAQNNPDVVAAQFSRSELCEFTFNRRPGPILTDITYITDEVDGRI